MALLLLTGYTWYTHPVSIIPESMFSRALCKLNFALFTTIRPYTVVYTTMSFYDGVTTTN